MLRRRLWQKWCTNRFTLQNGTNGYSSEFPKPVASAKPNSFAWQRIYRRILWQKQSRPNTMFPSIFVLQRKWLLILKLALRRQRVMPPSLLKHWEILPGQTEERTQKIAQKSAPAHHLQPPLT